MTKGCKSLFTYFENNILQKNTNKYSLFLKYSLNDLSKIVYRLEPEKNKNNIKIFGTNFVENNKDKCVIIYKDQIYPLKENFSIEGLVKENNQRLEILLIEFENISNKSYMFHECNQLEEFPLSNNNKIDLSESNIQLSFGTSNKQENNLNFYYNYNNMNNEESKKNKIELPKITSFLSEYKSMSFFLDNTKLNTCIYTNMEHMFDGCSSLLYLPDICHWITKNVKDMSYIFSGCSSLISLPDISN